MKIAVGLILFSMGVSACATIFIFGLFFMYCKVLPYDMVGFFFVIFSLPAVIICTIAMIILRNRIELFVEYGDPIYKTISTVKNIVNDVNMYAISECKGMIENKIKKRIDDLLKGVK